MRLLEDESKARLSAGGVRVLRGVTAVTPDGAVAAARTLGGRVFVKALVPANRRREAGGVRGPLVEYEVATASGELLGATICGFVCDAVYVEEAIAITRELYLAFSFGFEGPYAAASAAGGVDIEESRRGIVHQLVGHRSGLTSEEAGSLWRRAGAGPAPPQALVDLTVAASAVFTDDSTVVELNPVAITGGGDIVAVGGLIELDDAALFRHPEVPWRTHGLTEREAMVVDADRRIPGASVRYVELDGDVGLLIGGGGAGLYQHDLLVKAGARPANHSDMGAGVSADKLDVLIEAVLGHPRLSSLLVGYNLLQMARCDLIMGRLLAALDRLGLGNGDLPIVVRLEGLGAERARRLAAGRRGLTFLPPDAGLAEAVETLLSRRPQ